VFCVHQQIPCFGVMHQTCLVLWTWRKLADETNVKIAPKICWKIVPTWGIQTALTIHIMQSQDYPYAKDEYKLVIAIYCTRMTILEQEMNANVWQPSLAQEPSRSRKNPKEWWLFWYERGMQPSAVQLPYQNNQRSRRNDWEMKEKEKNHF